jgi:hypothetical protein
MLEIFTKSQTGARYSALKEFMWLDLQATNNRMFPFGKVNMRLYQTATYFPVSVQFLTF